MSSSLAGEGVEGAFERLYRRHRRDVYRFVLRDVRNPEEAEDVTQTAFLNAYRALQQGDHPEKPRAWLLTIAQNVSRRRFRARAVRPQEVELDPEHFVAAQPDGPTAGDIRDALLRLRPNHRAVIVLREIGGLTYAEIAETLGLSLSAVETLLFRARRALREELTAGEGRRAFRVGGFVLPLPGVLSDPLRSLAGWLGRRAATAQLAGAVGATVIGTGLAVQTGAIALPGSEAPAVAPGAPAAPAFAGDVREARPLRVRHARAAKQAHRRSAATAAKPSRGEGGGASAVLGIEVPGVTLPELPQPSVSLPTIDLPEVDQPTIDLPEVDPTIDVPDVGVPTIDVPDAEPPLSPELSVPLPDVEAPPLPDADELLP